MENVIPLMASGLYPLELSISKMVLPIVMEIMKLANTHPNKTEYGVVDFRAGVHINTKVNMPLSKKDCISPTMGIFKSVARALNASLIPEVSSLD